MAQPRKYQHANYLCERDAAAKKKPQCIDVGLAKLSFLCRTIAAQSARAAGASLKSRALDFLVQGPAAERVAAHPGGILKEAWLSGALPSAFRHSTGPIRCFISTVLNIFVCPVTRISSVDSIPTSAFTITSGFLFLLTQESESAFASFVFAIVASSLLQCLRLLLELVAPRVQRSGGSLGLLRQGCNCAGLFL